MIHTKPPLRLSSLFLVSIFLSISFIIQGRLQHNWDALVVLGALQSGYYPYVETQGMIQAYARDSCQRHWLLGLAAFQQGDWTMQDTEWAMGIQCNGGLVAPIQARQPSNWVLAELAVEYQPAEPGSWFWLADIEKESNPERAIGLIVQGLRLRPTAGVSWYRLAELYDRVGESYLAIDAYISSCAYLNRGSDCYVKAGNIYERLGNIQLAIYYYRLSIYDGAHQRADWLEKQFPP